MDNNINKIIDFIYIAKNQFKCNDILSYFDLNTINTISINLKLTEYMKNEFYLLSKYYKIRYGKDLEILNKFINITSNTKKEGKIIFEKIKNKLLTN